MKNYEKFAGEGQTIKGYECWDSQQTVTVMGGVHGNETVGIDVINAIWDNTATEQLPVTVKLIAGNPEAIEANVRFIQYDLNRCFGISPANPTHEQQRAIELKPLLDKTDILLDVHSTIKPSKPFIAAPNLDDSRSSILPYLNIPTILTGPGLLSPDGQPIYADTYVNSKGGFGVTIEAGCVSDPCTSQIIASIQKALAGINPSNQANFNSDQPIEVFHAYKNIIAGKGFAFTKEYGNWEEISAGTVLATQDSGQIIVEVDSYILFPKSPKDIVTGNEVCILAEKRS